MNPKNCWAQTAKNLCILAFVSMSTSHAKTSEQRIDGILAQMSVSEKYAQLYCSSAIGGTPGWTTTDDNTRINIPGFKMGDGPHGVGKGLVTAFPYPMHVAASWDTSVARKAGKAMATEFAATRKNTGLLPCTDLIIDPRNGRAAEGIGEDPYLGALITAASTRGVQQMPVMATVKHFACNARENGRETNNVIVDQRSLIEFYGAPFRRALQYGGALSLMGAYNLINGSKCSENGNLTTGLVRDKWGFPFTIMSDWAGIWDAKRAILAGTDLCMGNDIYRNNLANLVSSGQVPIAVVDNAVRNVLRTKLVLGAIDGLEQVPSSEVNSTAQQALNREIARKGMVLLKNNGAILPLSKSIGSVALIGPSADYCQVNICGSSGVDAAYTVTPRQGITNVLGSLRVKYSKGCDINSSNTSGFQAAKDIAQTSDVVVFVGGLDSTQEGEAYCQGDRKGGSVDLPGQQQNLINQLAAVNPNVVVVLISGGICAVHSSIGSMKGLLYGFMPGNEGGNAIADVLFGDYNPSGKLPITMPTGDAQLPPWDDDFKDDVIDGSGYRWFDAKGYTSEFAFGYGLSYTTFAYSNISVTPASAAVGQEVKVAVDVKNTGSRAGEEVAQLYLQTVAIVPNLPMPVKQLKGFNKVTLAAGETQRVEFTLGAEELYVYDSTSSKYVVPYGSYTVKIGPSSDNLPLSANFSLANSTAKPDLIVTNICMVPRNPHPGDTVSFIAWMVNKGTGSSPSGTVHRVSFKVDGVPAGSSAHYNQSIPVAGMAVVHDAGTFVWTSDGSAPVELQAVVDDNASIDETIENNNSCTSNYSRLYPDPNTGNLAYAKPVITSSTESSALAGQYAVDGTLNTRWSSAPGDPQWIYVDLQNTYKITRVVLNWESAYASSYKIQISHDATTWTDMYATTSGNGGDDDISGLSSSGRYVRMYGSTRATAYGHSLYEFKVYGESSTAIPLGRGSSASLAQGSSIVTLYDVLGRRIIQMVDKLNNSKSTTSKMRGVRVAVPTDAKKRSPQIRVLLPD